MSETLENRVAELERELTDLRDKVHRQERDNTVCIICFSGEWDKVFAALTLANGALAMGCDVHVFCTFWGACMLRGEDGCPPENSRGWMQKMMSWMLPKKLENMPLSKWNFCGMGKRAMRYLMKQHGVPDLESLLRDAKDLGAHFHICDTSVSLFGWEKEDLLNDLECDRCGVATFLSLGLKSQAVFFI